MSSYATHMLIGAVGGLALTRMLSPSSPDFSPIVVELGVIAASALLATWPDIDEPKSFIGRRVRAVVAMFCMGWLGFVAYRYAGYVPIKAHPLVIGLAGLCVGAVCGSFVGTLVLKLIREAAGGHRRLTHSLIVGMGLGLGAYVAYRFSFDFFALGFAALAWGQIVHILGDIVTPAGVPVLYPLSSRDLRILPHWLARFGELLIGSLAVLLALILLRA
jgi:membrane-bound metal-dependent hydrolase YbcI (DUF457 family)